MNRDGEPLSLAVMLGTGVFCVITSDSGVGTGADIVYSAPCFDTHDAVLAVHDTLLPFLISDFAFDCGDCRCDVGHSHTPSAEFDLL